MALTTGTMSTYGSQFSFPSGTVIYACEVIDVPELTMNERSTTNHGSGGFDERRPNGLVSMGDFTVGILSTPNAINTLKTDAEAGTERTYHIKGRVYQWVGVGWISHIKPEALQGTPDADTEKVTVTITPVGSVGQANA